MKNLEIYEKYRAVPQEAQKEIKGGRLKGMTDINPMWRIKCLTEAFGPCGIGWLISTKDRWTETTPGGEVVANVEIALRIKCGSEWSGEITGVGGSMLVSNEKNGLYVNDEAFKMAYTDAISVACKMLGFGADVYWQKDRTKYAAQEPDTIEGMDAQEWLAARRVTPVETDLSNAVCESCGRVIQPYPGADGKMVSVKKHIGASRDKYGKALCIDCIKAL